MHVVFVIVYFVLVHCQFVQVPECPKDKNVRCIAVREVKR